MKNNINALWLMAVVYALSGITALVLSREGQDGGSYILAMLGMLGIIAAIYNISHVVKLKSVNS